MKKSKIYIILTTLITLVIGIAFLFIGLNRIIFKDLLVIGTIFVYIGLGLIVFTLVIHKILVEHYLKEEIKLN